MFQKRLKDDLIKKSRLIEGSKSTKSFGFPSSRQSKIQRIYKFALDSRGGSDLEYKLAEKIKDFLIKLSVLFKEKELKATVLKIIFSQARATLELILSICKINLEYVVIDQQVGILASCTGSATGFVCSWFSVGAILFGPPTILSVFFLRSLTQQFLNNRNYLKFKNYISEILKDQNFKEQIPEILMKAQGQIENSKAIKLEHLNWNKNPAIKEASERLRIFENVPSASKPLNLDTLNLDPDLEEIFKELGFIKTQKLKTPIKAKTVYFKDFVGRMVDNDSDLDIIDDVINVEVIQEPLRIRIRDN